MEVLRFTKLMEHFSLQLKKKFSESDSNFVAMKNYSKNIFTSFLLIISFVITAQKLPSNKDKIYFQVDRFVANPNPSNLLKLEKFDRDITTVIRKSNDKNELLALVILNCNKGYYETLFNTTSKAISSYEKAWQTYQKNQLKNYDIIEFCLIPLGNLYTIVGDFDNAENTIKQYYYIATETKNQQQQYAAVLNLSNVYQNTGRINEAIDLLEKTIKSQKLTNLQKGSLYNNLGSNYFLHTAPNKMIPNAFENAEKAYLKAVLLLVQENTHSEALANTYRNLSKLKLEKNEIELALQYFEKAKSEFRKTSKKNSRTKAQFNFDEANILFKKENFEEATTLIKEIFLLLIPSYSNEKTLLPSEKSLYAETILLDAIDLQAAIYKAQNKPQKAIESYKLSFFIEDIFQSSLLSENSKIINQIRNRNRTEKCIAIYEDLYKKDKNTAHLENAFLLSEQTKSAVLKQGLIQSKKQSRIEKQILTQLQNENIIILKEQQKGELASINKINEAISKQSELMLQLKQIDIKTPSKSTQNINLNDLYNKLKEDNAVLIQYFSGIEKMYSFTIMDKKIYLNSFRNNSYNSAKIIQFLDFFNDANSIANSPKEYNQRSTIAYQLLNLPKSKSHKNLVVIPDGLLNFLPFEALITKASATTNFAKMNYFLNDFNVGYQNSAHFYLSSKESKKQPEQTVLGMFPIFENTTYALTFSKGELQSIREKFKGNYFENTNATFKNFKKNANKYSILHLSTHASSGDIQTPASIRFYDQEILYTELYNLNIHPDLVVLSACETGIGKLFKSEGAMSIARGFQFAGAQNLLFSLWKVNDYTTSIFMDLFYTNIKKNQSYLEANANAKRDYLKSATISNAKKSPYYWSTFVYYGSVEKEKISPNYIYYSTGLLMLISLFLIYIRTRK